MSNPSNPSSTVLAAFADWYERAAKLGGRDTMLHFRESRDGSLDLTGAHPSGLAQLLAGRATRLSSLVRDAELLVDARRRIKTIRHKAQQLSYERGISTAHLAIGFANWSRDIDGSRTEFSAPILLRHVELAPRGDRVEDFEITLADDTVVNPALVEYLAREYNVRIDTDEWIASTHHAHGFDPSGVYERLRVATRSVPGVLVSQRLVVSTFANIPTPFSRGDLPEDHPVLRALAGDAVAQSDLGRGRPAAQPNIAQPSTTQPSTSAGATDAQPNTTQPTLTQPSISAGATDAHVRGLPTLGAATRVDEPADGAAPLPQPSGLRKRRELRDTSRSQVAGVSLPDRSPDTEFIAIDVDGDQQAAVDAALAGDSFVLDTPPGTGATQVAVAMATALTHAGKSVLYVGQSSDVLDDFAHRLDESGLRGFVVDGRVRESALKANLVSLIISAERAENPDLSDTLATLRDTRSRLANHVRALHATREPWGSSVYATLEHLAALTASDPGPVTSVRFDEHVMELSAASRAALRSNLLDLSALGAFTMDVEDTVWFGARFSSDEAAEKARAQAERAARLGSALVTQAESALRDAGMNPHRNVDAWGTCLKTLVEVRDMLQKFDSAVFDQNLEELIAATGSGEYRRRNNIDLGMFERSKLKKLARSLVKDPGAVGDVHAELIAARQLREQWTALTRDSKHPVAKAPDATAAYDTYEELSLILDQLDPVLADTPDGGDLGGMLVEELIARLTAMGEDRAALADLPARTSADEQLRQQGLGELLDDLRDRKVPHALVGQEFDLAYWATVLQQMAEADPEIGGHDGAALDALARDFCVADREFVAAGAKRLAFAHATQWRRAIAAHTNEAESVRTALRAPHLHLDQLASESPHVLAALAPLWMMSPFDVPTHFGPGQFFDVVILADSARLSVAEAVPAIARAGQVIALGDPRLPGPRPFSVAVNRHSAPVAPDADSVFTELAQFLPVLGLSTYHRAAPRGLLNLVNDQFYGSTLTALPTAHTNEGTGLEFAYVQDAVGVPDSATGQVESPDQEVSRVVDLVLRHARTKARQSLAVVTLTPWHAARVAAAVQQAIRQYPYVATFFTDTSKEPFIVTDVERIQGFARDSVIFSIGYGCTLQGRVLYNFGALERAGGEQMLAAIVTRARTKLTVVSSFNTHDLDPSRLKHGALKLLDIITAVASGSRVQGSGVQGSRVQGSGAQGTTQAEVVAPGDQASSAAGGGTWAVDADNDRANMVRVDADGAGAASADVGDTENIDAESIDAGSIDAGRTDAGSIDAESAVAGSAVVGRTDADSAASDDPLLSDIVRRLRAAGAHPVLNYEGIEVALPAGEQQHQLPPGMVLAIETDGPAYAATQSIRQRERLRREALERRGWTYVRLWSMDAFVDPQAVTRRLVTQWQAAVEARSPQSVLEAARAAAVVTGRRGSRPAVKPGLPLHAYSDTDLDAMVEWIQSDGQHRDNAELAHQLEQALAHRGHADQGDTIGRAVRRYRAAQARTRATFDSANAQFENTHRAETESDNPAFENTAPGDSASKNPAPENTASGNSARENTAPGDSASENTASENPARENTAPENTASGDFSSENTASDSSASGNTAPGNTAADDQAVSEVQTGDAAIADVARQDLASDNTVDYKTVQYDTVQYDTVRDHSVSDYSVPDHGVRGGTAVDQDSVMPVYDTGVLRDNELIDAGLRADERHADTAESTSESTSDSTTDYSNNSSADSNKNNTAANSKNNTAESTSDSSADSSKNSSADTNDK